MPIVGLYVLLLGLAVEKGHQQWLIALQKVHNLRWAIMSHPPTAVGSACKEFAIKEPGWVRCQKMLQWKKQGIWTSVCIDYANGEGSYSPRHYRIQLACTWMSIALPQVEVRVFR